MSVCCKSHVSSSQQNRGSRTKPGWCGGAPMVLRCAFYFRLMVVLTPWLVVLSSNQRAVIVLVWV